MKGDLTMEIIPWRQKRHARSGQEERPLARLREEMQHAFERFLRDPWEARWPGLFQTTDVFPHLDLAESDSDVTIRAELPGVQPKDVHVEVTGQVLKLSGEKSAQREEKGRDYHCCERQFGSFSRTVQLPTSVDPAKVDARYKDGVLTITLAKNPEARPKRITVRNA
jgi:HSP20 family protein